MKKIFALFLGLMIVLFACSAALADVAAAEAANDSNEVVMAVASSVKITKQPANAFAASGKSAKVSVTASGDGLSYCWYYKTPGGSKFVKSSVTTTSYSMSMTEEKSGRQVYCVVKDKYGNEVKSNTVTLTMITPVKITKQPGDAFAASGKSAKVSVTASGDGLTYCWYYKTPGSSKFVKSSVTTTSYSMSMTAEKSGRQVYCAVKDKYGNEVKSNTVTLTMITPVKITRQPADVVVASGKTAKVSVTASGDGLTYCWYYKESGNSKFVKSSVTTTSYSMSMTAAKSGRQVYCVVTDKYGNEAKSSTVTLSVITGTFNTDYAQQVVDLVNAERAEYGLPALRIDSELSRAANVRGEELVQNFSHTRPDGSSCFTVSHKAYGENIAMGYRTPNDVMAGWLGSEGHRANILRERFGSIGVCAYVYGGVVYWVQLFGM